MSYDKESLTAFNVDGQTAFLKLEVIEIIQLLKQAILKSWVGKTLWLYLVMLVHLVELYQDIILLY